MWRHLLTKLASYKAPLVMVSTHGSVVPLAMFSTNLGSEENQDDKSTKSGKLLFHLSENTWRCHLVACYPPIWPRPEHINKTRGECLVSPISGFNIEDAPSPAISKCET